MATLIAYFSRADENYFAGTLKSVKIGNTEIVAKMLQHTETKKPLTRPLPKVVFPAKNCLSPQNFGFRITAMNTAEKFLSYP